MDVLREIIITADQIDKNHVNLVGSRAISRYITASLGLRVPPFFVITSHAFQHFLQHENGLSKWQNILENCRPFSPEDLLTTSQALQKLVLNHSFSKDLSDALSDTYHQVFGSKWCHLTISPTPETRTPVNTVLPTIKGEVVLLDFVRQLWAAQLTPHAIATYTGRKDNQAIHLTPIMASVFEPANACGTMYTVDPGSADKNLLRIEAIFGANPQNDPRRITPDIYIGAKDTKTIISKHRQKQDSYTTIDRFGHNKIIKLSDSKQSEAKIADKTITELLQAGIKIQNHMLKPQVINWLTVGNTIYFTRFSELDSISTVFTPIQSSTPTRGHKVIASGVCAAPGITTAPLIHVGSSAASLTGKIAIFNEPDSKQIKSARSAAGIIIQAGGLSSELAMIARELGIPTLVGTGVISLTNGNSVTLDASGGKVLQSTAASTPKVQPTAKPTPSTAQSTFSQTATKIYLNTSVLETTEVNTYLDADGVGLCRGSELLIQNNTHPKFLLTKDKTALKKRLMIHLKEMCEQFGDRPVWYLPYDLDEKAARELLHGPEFEPSSGENPLLGFRGANRIIADSNVFELELDCITHLRQKDHCNNLFLIIPLVRSIDECASLKRMMGAKNLHTRSSFLVKVEVSTPSAAYLIPEIAELGISGIHINLDTLTSLMLGYDSNNAEIDDRINLAHPAVLAELTKIVTVADRSNLSVSVSGYLLDQRRDVLEAVLHCGVSAVSISSHRLFAVKDWVKQIETKIATTHKITDYVE